MENDVQKLTYAVLTEWTEDPPAGCVTVYYDVWGTEPDELLWPVKEIGGHLTDYLEGDEKREVEELVGKVLSSQLPLTSFSWENGGMGCGCSIYAKGTDIVQEALDFYTDVLGFGEEEEEEYEDFDEDEDLDDDDDEDEDGDADVDRAAIIEAAKAHPDDYDSVIALLEMISEAAAEQNDEELF